ncbi:MULTISPECIES: tetratricopeptide repeat protein [unclassified Aureispira]|uniref:tetratricopeptide repeat protein n=1 Tax=unclassified Aureispira TaxID=2649989 RepID=UPI0006965112|nr:MULTISPECIES: tetratricopeptide repeat protein [unclassified Aureispira]WMX16487.1 tetratricopeptide repeat protein [Aureispira sp. CCB-E]
MRPLKSIGLFLLLIGNSILFAQDSTSTSTIDSSANQGNNAKYFAQLPPPEPEENAETLMKEAIVHFDGGRYQKSIEILDEALKINEFPQLAPILHFYRAVSKVKVKQYESAIPDYTKAIQLNPQKSKYIYHRGLAYFQLGQYEEAKKDFQSTLVMDGGNADIYVKLAFLKQQENDLKGAIEDYTKAIEFNPKFATPYYYRGLIYLQVLLHDKACADIKKAANLGHPLALRQYDKYCEGQ